MANPFLDPPGRAYDWAEGNPIGTSRVEFVRSAEGQPFDPLVRLGFGDKPRTQSGYAKLFDDGMTTSGAVGSIGGQFARGADLKKLLHAQKLESRSELPRTILQKTGWWKNPQGEWKFEIPDENMFLRVSEDLRSPGLNWDKGDVMLYKPGQPLSDIIEHEELFKHYPAFRDIKVGNDMTGGGQANWDYKNHQINISPGYKTIDDMRKLLGHEITHATQSFEGWQNGTAPQMFLPKNFKEMADVSRESVKTFVEMAREKGIPVGSRNELIATARTAVEGGLTPKHPYFMEFSEFLVKNPELGQLLMKAGQDSHVVDRIRSEAHEMYKSVTGEADARAVQNRLDMNQRQKDMKPFWESYDVSPRYQKGSRILPWNGGR